MAGESRSESTAGVGFTVEPELQVPSKPPRMAYL
jgi:hypothetical protein